jgi:glycosyltransferase involved in cell wall biosynthesis
MQSTVCESCTTAGTLLYLEPEGGQRGRCLKGGKRIRARSGQFIKLDLIEFTPRQWLVIPNGSDTQEFVPDPAARREVREDLGLPTEALLIGMVARFEPLKDHGTLLQAAGLLGRRWPDVHFI